MKKVLLFFLAILVTSNLFAAFGLCDFQIDGIYYCITSSSEVCVTHGATYTDGSWSWDSRKQYYSGYIVIPSSVTCNNVTYSVTSIDEAAFQNQNISSVLIPESVTSIGKSAFEGCSELTSVTMSNSVSTIGETAFAASGLTEITIPNSITSIGNRAFAQCIKLTSVTIPESIFTIGENAFDITYGMVEVINLSSLNITAGSNDCGGVAKHARYVCNGGKTVIGDFIFSNRDKTLVYYTGAAKSNITFPENFNGGEYALGDCVFAPLSVMGGWGFQRYSCFSRVREELQEKLTSLTIPNSVTNIPNLVFSCCRNLSSVSIGESVTSIGDSAFFWCGNLRSVTIPESVTYIGNYAFQQCGELRSMTLPNSVIFLGDNAFQYCYNMSSLTLSNSLTNIGKNVFEDCVTLNYLTIPESVTSIGDYAFHNIQELRSITIPSTVSNIGKSAFTVYDNGLLTNIICYAPIPPIVQANNFNTANKVALYVPCESVSLYKQDAVWGTFKNIYCISEATALDADEVFVDPKQNEAIFSLPFVDGAESYSLVISKEDGSLFCTINFDGDGCVKNIQHARTKKYDLKDNVAGYLHTATKLIGGTNYTYKYGARDAVDVVFKVYTGAFRTTGTATGINNVEQEKIISTMCNQILVNGEAPAFVYTISGQKIANNNLKSGVYYVNVEGENVKVLVQ